MALTKRSIAGHLQFGLRFAHKQSIDSVESLLAIITSALEFGAILWNYLSACPLPARRVVTFKWSGRMRDTINGG